jgi:hypothetical protein
MYTLLFVSLHKFSQNQELNMASTNPSPKMGDDDDVDAMLRDMDNALDGQPAKAKISTRTFVTTTNHRSNHFAFFFTQQNHCL